MKSLLVRLIGFSATLMHGDTMVLDRWLWLKKRLRSPGRSANLLEVGCGSGAFTIGAARLGYHATGISWDERNQTVAAERAKICGADRTDFLIGDARKLGEDASLKANYDVVICLECIEHILNDEKLMKDLAGSLRDGGQLLLTTPNVNYRPLTAGDNGPWSVIEDGGHVRKGYSEERLRELCRIADLKVEEVSYCSGILSQQITRVYRLCRTVNPIFASLMILPLRVIPPLLDQFATRVFRWPDYSICLDARKIEEAN